MPTLKGILSFQNLFVAKVAKGASEPKFSCSLLLPPTDPQVAQIQAEVEQAKLNTFPNGYTGTHECLQQYDVAYAGKDYYDPRFSGWWVFSCSAKADDKPAVVDANRQPSMEVFSGMIVYVSAGISGYIKGTGGIGGWLNGVMITEETPTMGRLDGKPSVDQMFAGVGAPAAPVAPAAPAAPVAPVAPAAPVPTMVMTAAANGMTYDQYKVAGWTDDQMIAGGVAIKPSFA